METSRLESATPGVGYVHLQVEEETAAPVMVKVCLTTSLGSRVVGGSADGGSPPQNFVGGRRSD